MRIRLYRAGGVFKPAYSTILTLKITCNLARNTKLRLRELPQTLDISQKRAGCQEIFDILQEFSRLLVRTADPHPSGGRHGSAQMVKHLILRSFHSSRDEE